MSQTGSRVALAPWPTEGKLKGLEREAEGERVGFRKNET